VNQWLFGRGQYTKASGMIACLLTDRAKASGMVAGPLTDRALVTGGSHFASVYWDTSDAFMTSRLLCCPPIALSFQGLTMGTWPSRLGESRIWASKIWSRVPRSPDLRTTVLARASSNCKQQLHPLIREDVA
jgi:hypothetical protein